MTPTRFASTLSIAAAAVFAILAADIRAAHADVIRSPTSVVLNTMGEYSSSFPATEAIDQSDLSAGFVSGTTDFDAYLAGNPTQTGNPGGAWFAALGTVVGTIGFDLGGTFSITRLALWNIGDNDDNVSGPYGANVRSFEVYTSSVSDFSSETLVGSFTATSGTVAYDTVGAQVFDLTDTVARYVRLRILSNFGATHTTGIGELALATTAPPTTGGVPEPSILFLMATGALAAASRRRG